MGVGDLCGEPRGCRVGGQRRCSPPGLVGVQQVALNAERLSFEAVERIAKIPKLESLVLRGSSLPPKQVEALASLGPHVELIT